MGNLIKDLEGILTCKHTISEILKVTNKNVKLHLELASQNAGMSWDDGEKADENENLHYCAYLQPILDDQEYYSTYTL